MDDYLKALRNAQYTQINGDRSSRISQVNGSAMDACSLKLRLVLPDPERAGHTVMPGKSSVDGFFVSEQSLISMRETLFQCSATENLLSVRRSLADVEADLFADLPNNFEAEDKIRNRVRFTKEARRQFLFWSKISRDLTHKISHQFDSQIFRHPFRGLPFEPYSRTNSHEEVNIGWIPLLGPLAGCYALPYNNEHRIIMRPANDGDRVDVVHLMYIYPELDEEDEE